MRMFGTILTIFLSLQSYVQQPAQKQFDALSFLVGHWTGEGTTAPDRKSVEFLSEPLSGSPRYRLTYTKAADPDLLKLTFEMANKGDAFASYIDATLHRIR
jgi:hypothetical protein